MKIFSKVRFSKTFIHHGNTTGFEEINKKHKTFYIATASQKQFLAENIFRIFVVLVEMSRFRGLLKSVLVSLTIIGTFIFLN